MTPLLAGRYDAVAVTQFGELVQARLAGQELGLPGLPRLGHARLRLPQHVSRGRSVAAQHPATVRGFVKATLAGLQYAAAHPSRPWPCTWPAIPELNKTLLLAQWQAASASLARGRGAPGGLAGPGGLAAAGRLDGEHHLLTKPVDVGSAVSNAYLPAP